MTPHSILVAYDFSERAGHAVRFAAQLAQRTDGKLHVVYVLPDIYHGHSDLSLALPAAVEGQGERYMRFLQEELERSTRELVGAQLAVDAHVLRGDPSECVADLARELAADTVCVGATGKRASERVLLGSVSQRLLRTLSVPVVTVP